MAFSSLANQWLYLLFLFSYLFNFSSYLYKTTNFYFPSVSPVQLLRPVWLLSTPWTAEHQASLSITNPQSFLKLISIQLVMPSNHLILCYRLLLLPSIFPSIRVFSNESALHIRWPKYWSFTFSINPFNEYSGLVSFRIDWFDHFLSKRLSRVFSKMAEE